MATSANLERMRIEKLGLERLAKIEETPPYKMMFLNPYVVGEYESIKTIDLGKLQADYDRVIPYEKWTNQSEN